MVRARPIRHSSWTKTKITQMNFIFVAVIVFGVTDTDFHRLVFTENAPNIKFRPNRTVIEKIGFSSHSLFLEAEAKLKLRFESQLSLSPSFILSLFHCN